MKHNTLVLGRRQPMDVHCARTGRTVSPVVVQAQKAPVVRSSPTDLLMMLLEKGHSVPQEACHWAGGYGVGSGFSRPVPRAWVTNTFINRIPKEPNSFT